MTSNTIPTQNSERIDSLDFLRGVAVLGILLINIESFSYPNPFSPYQFGFDSPADTTTRFWVYFLTQGKFFSIFALLFGVGFYIFLERISQKESGLNVLDLYARRMLWLFLFGVFHAYFLWPGDILYHYAICGLLLVPFRALSVNRLLLVIIIPIGVLLYNSFDSNNRTKVQYDAYVKSVIIEENNQTEEDKKNVRRWESRISEKSTERYNTTIEARQGDYLKNLNENANHIKVHKGTLFYQGLFFRTLVMMLLGILLYKTGVFKDFTVIKHYWLITMAVFVLALVMNFYRYKAWTYAYSDPVKDLWTAWFYTFPKELLGLGYVLVLNGIYQKFLRNPFWKLVSNTGKMALTNYLMQTVICMFIFYGFGWGKYNSFSRYELLPVVGSIWLFQLCFSYFWLSRYRYGPMEWLWRKLTYGNLKRG